MKTTYIRIKVLTRAVVISFNFFLSDFFIGISKQLSDRAVAKMNGKTLREREHFLKSVTECHPSRVPSHHIWNSCQTFLTSQTSPPLPPPENNL